MNPQIETAKAEFERTTGRLLKNLASTPDDKLDWSPASTARTPREIAFHCADIIAMIHGSLDGADTMPQLSTEQIDAYCREKEASHGTREDVVKLINENSTAFVAWLEGLSDEKLAGTWQSPFGDISVAVAITLPTYHTANHIAQLEYIQTIYGDRVWH